jgi:hypothetical protein
LLGLRRVGILWSHGGWSVMARRRSLRAPGRHSRCRLVSVAWLVEESRVLEIVALAQAAGFSVTVAPTVHVVSEGGASPAGGPFTGPPGAASWVT